MIKQYVRRHSNRVKIGMFVAEAFVGEDGTDCYKIGWSLCCKKDKFTPNLGEAIAVGRMNSPNINMIPDSIKDDKEKFLERCQKYFKYKPFVSNTI